MKQQIIISVLAYAIGLIFTLLTFIPSRLGFELPYLGGLIGLLLLVFSLLYGIVMLNKTKSKYDKLVSSRLTPLYKFYFPITFIIFLLFNTLLILFDIYPGNDISIFVVIEIMFVIWLILFIPCIKLRMLYLKNSQIITTDFLSESKLQVDSIKSIKRFFFFFYRIKIEKETSSQKIIFLPRLTEFSNLFITPKSIKDIKSLINH